MEISRYLVIGRKNRYGKPSTRLTTNAPSLESHEIAMLLNLDIPESLFKKPQLEATISVSEDSVLAPVIEAKVINTIQAVIEKELGIDLKISIVNTEIPS